MKKNALEWTVFGGSLIVLAVVVALLVRAELSGADGPPVLAAEVGQPQRHGSHYALPLEVRNAGGTTAEEVDVEVVLTAGGGEERASVVIPFLPRGSRRTAWVTFTADPASGSAVARIRGYREP
jgi:uncharacterized protein (TIGR02588 family)